MSCRLYILIGIHYVVNYYYYSSVDVLSTYENRDKENNTTSSILLCNDNNDSLKRAHKRKLLTLYIFHFVYILFKYI